MQRKNGIWILESKLTSFWVDPCTRDGADRKFVPTVRTTSGQQLSFCPHRVRICCTFPCPRVHCTAIPEFYPLTAIAICTLSPEALCFS